MFRRLGSALVALAALAVVTLGRVPAGAEPSGPWLTGQFLVATEKLGDPRFDHTVIYLVAHDLVGAMGLVVNRPIGQVPLARALEAFGLDSKGVTGDIRVHYGGPVEPARGFVLHSSDYAEPGTQPIRKGVALTVDREILEAIAHGKGPRQARLTFGYAGWAAGQLEGEIGRGDWITVPADDLLLFDSDDSRKWERATARMKIEL